MTILSPVERPATRSGSGLIRIYRNLAAALALPCRHRSWFAPTRSSSEAARFRCRWCRGVASAPPRCGGTTEAPPDHRLLERHIGGALRVVCSCFSRRSRGSRFRRRANRVDRILLGRRRFRPPPEARPCGRLRGSNWCRSGRGRLQMTDYDQRVTDRHAATLYRFDNHATFPEAVDSSRGGL